ncbi:MAG: hypothetical protein MUD01_09715 [Chloroflexaceae bacterium]|jgi:hypothetical protein|nr:hypothetical protein [Chloroflexaceae bacterium]
MFLVAYDQQRASAMLQEWSATRLLQELEAGHFGVLLSDDERCELHDLLQAWVQRALGPMPLRDAILVDPQRGWRVYDLICIALADGPRELPPESGAALTALNTIPLTPEQLRQRLNSHGGTDGISAMLARAETENLVFTYSSVLPLRFPQPDLDTLMPPLPPAARTTERFEHPSGRRRIFAMALALLGVLLLAIPMLFGEIPAQPAGLPLALITLALLVGVRARWPGYLGSVCIWLVANLPGFSHNRMVALWPDVPLLVLGVCLLALDSRIRLMWRWIRARSDER